MLLPIDEFSSSDDAKKLEPYASQLAWGIILLAFLLCLTSFNRGLQSDDFIHRYMLTEQNAFLPDTLNHFYEFLNPYDTVPWWTQEDLKIKFWRPLSALSHWLDYQIWPDSPRLMHLQNGLWYVLLTALALSFFKRLMPLQGALLAGIIFALDFTHFANLSWIANRNSLIVTCFIILTLNYYLDWRTKGGNKNISLSFLFFIISLFCGEAAVITLACIFSLELLLSKNTGKYFPKEFQFSLNSSEPKAVILVFSAFLLIFIIWLGFYTQHEFGSKNNSMYFSPGEDLLFSTTLLLQKIPVFIFGSLFGVEGFFNVLSHELKLMASISCSIFLGILFYFCRALFLSKAFVFYFICAIASLIPVSFVAVTDMRLSLISSVFCAAILSMIFLELLRSNSKIKKSLLIYLLFMHFALASGQWLYVGIKDFLSPPLAFSRLIKLQEKYPEHDLYLINYPSPIDSYYLPFAYTDTEKTVTVLTNNFSNYQLNAQSKNQFNINTKTGFIFKNSDFNEIDLKNKPLHHGVYARSAFNGVISKDYNFFSNQKFSRNGVEVVIVEALDKGVASNIVFNIQTEEDTFKLLLWDSSKKQFTELQDFPLSQKVFNW